VDETIARIRELDFAYARGLPLALESLSLSLRGGQRHLLVGANGSGKTTLLRVLAGKHMVPRQAVEVLGRPAFHDTSLTDHVQLIGGSFPCDVDVTVEEMLEHRTVSHPKRLEELLAVLAIDTSWHMHRVSDGQRRRVQLLVDLLAPKRLLLLDEVTTDLDLVVRADLLGFLKRDSIRLSTCVFYATHIFDGLEEWATHLTALEQGRVKRSGPLEEIEELEELRHGSMSSPLYRLVEKWLRYGVS
jgi:CCR4-NOT complex subunit CAF16